MPPRISKEEHDTCGSFSISSMAMSTSCLPVTTPGKTQLLIQAIEYRGTEKLRITFAASLRVTMQTRAGQAASNDMSHRLLPNRRHLRKKDSRTTTEQSNDLFCSPSL